MIVMDSFALPVEGTETRVNAAAEGAAYMIQYLEACEKTNKEEPGLGWYHSVSAFSLPARSINCVLEHQNIVSPFFCQSRQSLPSYRS